MKNDFLVVHKKICGENYEQVIEARRLINAQKMSISEACEKMGISRGIKIMFLSHHQSLEKEQFLHLL